ncbi:MAG: hypothetical protein AAB691_00840 [Patescibacteria group bacterium]
MKNLPATQGELKAILPQAKRQTLAIFEELGLTAKDAEVMQEVVVEYRVQLPTVARIMQKNQLSFDQAQEVILFQREYGELSGLSMGETARLFRMCSGDEASMDRFVGLAREYIDGVEGKGKYLCFAFLLHRTEAVFDGEIGAMSELLNQNDPRDVYDILRGKKLPDDPLVRETLNRFFEGGSDDYDGGSDDGGID